MLPLYAKVCELCNRGKGRRAIGSHQWGFFKLGHSCSWKCCRGRDSAKVPRNSADKRAKESRTERQRGTYADQQHFIYATDWGECIGTDRTAFIELRDGFRGRSVVRACRKTGDAVEQCGGLGAKFVRRVKFDIEREQQCAGSRSVRRLFRHGGRQELLGKRGGIEWRVRGVGPEPAGSQRQRIERPVGRK